MGSFEPGSGATKISKLRIVSLRIAFVGALAEVSAPQRLPITNPRKPGGSTRSFRRTMEEIGHGERPLIARRQAADEARAAAILGALFAMAIVGFGGASAWPFAIDDAFIGIRYARHLAQGAGYVWNIAGPRTDGVTPLPWALLLAPLAHAAPLVVLARVKVLGLLVWEVAAAFWAQRWDALGLRRG